MQSRLKELKSRGVKWIDLHYTDLVGALRMATASVDEVIERGSEGLPTLDGSSVIGFTDINESDLVLKPDLSTLALIPWSRNRARVFADVYVGVEGELRRLENDPRYVAERAEQYALSEGYKAYFGPEVEFMLLDKLVIDVSNPLRGLCYYVESEETPFSGDGYFQQIGGAYHTPDPINKIYDVALEIAGALRDHFGFEVEVFHHEAAAAGQLEIDFKFSSPKEAADRVMTLKYVAKNVAAMHGMVASFLPKPIYGDSGNGMHTHVSLWDQEGETNLFYDPNDSYAELSQLARYFIGGLIEHGRALAALVAPTTNSYRRLVPGYEAPVYLVWSRANRSAAIRVPAYVRGKPSSKRIEFRPPDPSANPYLAFTAILAAGLDGIRRKIDPGDPIDKNVYHMTPEERRRLGIKELPRSLDEALDELECDSDFLKPVIPKSVLEKYIEVKRKEADTVRMYPSPIEFYLYSLL